MRLILMTIFIGAFLDAGCQQGAPKQRRPGNDTTYNFKPASLDGTGKYYMGREIARVMGAAGSDWLERPERQQEENASLAIAKMGLNDSSVVADLGAGTGYYSFRIAPLVPNGKVYAVELQDELIDVLTRRKQETGLKNVFVVKGDTLSPNLPPNSVDLLFMVDVYHELAWPKEVLRAVYDCLKPGGRLLLIEYRGEDPSVPIKPLHKTTVKQMNKELAASGFEIGEKGDFLPIQHFLVYQKKIR
ncbi:MAG: class I SAM-dependent methyltransferase [Sphingobacteriales bacterium]|nr:MAG: class I SAM-dependent methyltransferase [Sphingobacteriales bacterium]